MLRCFECDYLVLGKRGRGFCYAHPSPSYIHNINILMDKMIRLGSVVRKMFLTAFFNHWHKPIKDLLKCLSSGPIKVLDFQTHFSRGLDWSWMTDNWKRHHLSFHTISSINKTVFFFAPFSIPFDNCIFLLAPWFGGEVRVLKKKYAVEWKWAVRVLFFGKLIQIVRWEKSASTRHYKWSRFDCLH